jgi:hypothetical protein
MIISRVESGDIIKGYYKSSNISLSEYNKSTKDLTITFNYGGVYKYNDVKDKDYFRFELDDSQGTILNSHIKAYSFEQMDSVEKGYVKKVIKEARESQMKILQMEIINIMSQIRVDWFQNGETLINAKLMKELDITRTELAKL